MQFRVSCEGSQWTPIIYGINVYDINVYDINVYGKNKSQSETNELLFDTE